MKDSNESLSKQKITKAAALNYDGVNSPKLVAKGQGKVAQEIISLAESNDIHVHYDPLLLDVLTRLELGDEIPETLYLAVAKIIAFAYYLQGKHPGHKDSGIKPDVLLSRSSQALELSDEVSEDKP